MPLSFAEIRARFDAEQLTPIVPQHATDMPPSYESITPEWLTAILGGSVAGAAVLAHALGPRDDGTSNRRRIEVSWNDAGKAAGLPASVFCKGTQSLASRYMLGMNEGVQAEVNFYTRVRPTLPVRAPEALFARYDPETLNSIIVMRDLREEVAFCRIDTVLTRAQVESQLRLLATLHGRYYASAELATVLAPFSNWERFFTITVEDAGFGEACIRGFNAARDLVPPRLFAREAEVWPATLRCAARHAELPRTLTHNDVHLKNWFIAADGEMGVNDWQNCCKGNWSRDLAYCLSTGLQPEQRRDSEQELLAFYLDQLAVRGGPRLEYADAFRLYRQQLFAALAWWTGTLGQPPDAPLMQPPATSCEFIRRMAIAIDDLDALDSF